MSFNVVYGVIWMKKIQGFSKRVTFYFIFISVSFYVNGRKSTHRNEFPAIGK